MLVRIEPGPGSAFPQIGSAASLRAEARNGPDSLGSGPSLVISCDCFFSDFILLSFPGHGKPRVVVDRHCSECSRLPPFRCNHPGTEVSIRPEWAADSGHKRRIGWIASEIGALKSESSACSVSSRSSRRCVLRCADGAYPQSNMAR